MTKEEILAGLKEIIADRLGSDVSNVDMKTTLTEDLQADSLDKVEMIMDAETKYNIEIDDDASMAFVTVGDVVDYIATKI
ncbi:MAG: acyl carrier protein [Clostridiales bacterium]|jgi:acyl carrier protein|nr:acyl carrier protein [Clostridiales bacterium]